jgi:hypothetical protein
VTQKHCACAHCGAGFVTSRKRKYCSAKCCWTANDRKRGYKPAHRRPACTCKHCGKTYQPKCTNRTTYCSRECAFAAQAKAKAARLEMLSPFTRVYRNTCIVCGKCWLAKRASTVCSSECSDERVRRRFREIAAAKKDLTPHLCKQCGVLFVAQYGDGRRVFCSRQCSVRAYRQKRGSDSHRARARRYGVAYEPVIPNRVFDRDGWRCQICGKQTPQSRRGSRYPNAPELDHRKPMSKGGAHSYANTQCTCRACNGAKNNVRETGQLPLLPITDPIPPSISGTFLHSTARAPLL